MLADTAVLTVAAAIFLAAGFVKGVLGMGLPLVAIGLLSLFMPPAQAAALTGILFSFKPAQGAAP